MASSLDYDLVTASEAEKSSLGGAGGGQQEYRRLVCPSLAEDMGQEGSEDAEEELLLGAEEDDHHMDLVAVVAQGGVQKVFGYVVVEN